MPEFTEFPKMARLNRNVFITEKIDGTNAAIGVTEDGEVYAQSRTRIISVDQDNFGFAAWVAEHADVLLKGLGPGLHFGEWWGSGIQRGYGLPKGEKRFSLFNTGRWSCYANSGDRQGLPSDWVCHECPVLYVVPVLDVWGKFDTTRIERQVEELRLFGSMASPGFGKPEGVVIFHSAANTYFKVTLEKDEVPKALAGVPTSERVSP